MDAAVVDDYINSRIPPRPVNALVTMLACFSLLGLLGNSLVLYVYVRKRNKLSSTVFIIALAAIDLVTSAVSMPYTIVVEVLNYQISLDFSCKLYYFMITCTVPFSVFIMVAIAIDRYLCICRPHSHVLDSVRARNSVLALMGLAIVIGLISALFHGVYLDMKTLRQHDARLHSVKETVNGNMGNVSEILSNLEAESCPNCVNHSADEAEFTERLASVIMELYKKACLNEKPVNESYIYTGHCLPNQILFSNEFRGTYQTIYSSSFLVCFSVVFVLYILIYRSVLVRRARRFAARAKNKLNLTQEVSLTENQSMLNDSPDKSIALNELNNDPKNRNHRIPSVKQSEQKGKSEEQQMSQHLLQTQSSQKKQQPQQDGTQKDASQKNGCLRDKYFLANIRTAIMLFVVTVAFVIAYLPSWLMAFKVIKFNVIVFYVYFSNHIVNPIIYAFMNPAFRRSLKGLLCRKKGRGL